MGRRQILSCDAAAKLYNAGTKKEAIAWRYGVTRGTVNRVLKIAREKGMLISAEERKALILEQRAEDQNDYFGEVTLTVHIGNRPELREPGDWGWGKYPPSPGVIEATKEDVARQLGRRNRKPLVLHKGGEI